MFFLRRRCRSGGVSLVPFRAGGCRSGQRSGTLRRIRWGIKDRLIRLGGRSNRRHANCNGHSQQYQAQAQQHETHRSTVAIPLLLRSPWMSAMARIPMATSRFVVEFVFLGGTCRRGFVLVFWKEVRVLIVVVGSILLPSSPPPFP